MHFIIVPNYNSASSTMFYVRVKNPRLMYWFALGTNKLRKLSWEKHQTCSLTKNPVQKDYYNFLWHVILNDFKI